MLSFDSIYVRQRKNILGETIDSKQCIFIIIGKSTVLSGRIWSGRNIITVWHAVYFTFTTKQGFEESEEHFTTIY